METILVLVLAFATGSVPVANVFARLCAGVDLREHGTGTVSGTSLYEVTDFPTLAVAGVLELAKGAAWPAIVLAVGDGADSQVLAGAAAGAAVAGHNWSPFLGGAGGRGISPAMGGLAVAAWPGALLLAAGLGLGKLADNTGLGSFVAQAAMLPVLAVTHGPEGAAAAAFVVVPMWAKRVVGNAPPEASRPRVYVNRLLYDQDRGESAG